MKLTIPQKDILNDPVKELARDIIKQGIISKSKALRDERYMVTDYDPTISVEEMIDLIVMDHLKNIDALAFESITDRELAAGKMVNLKASEIILRSKIPMATKPGLDSGESGNVTVIQNLGQLGLNVTVITKDNKGLLKKPAIEISSEGQDDPQRLD